jgi:hypothetical protein
MNRTVSTPEEIFEQAEALAYRAKASRSEVYARAFSEHLPRHTPDRVGEPMVRCG